MFALLAVLATLALSQADNGHAFTVPPQTSVIVLLSSNASTGYRWELAKPDRSVIRAVLRRFVQPKGNMPGSPGEQFWRLRTVGPGRVRLRFVYVRPWQPKRVARRFGVEIRVR